MLTSLTIRENTWNLIRTCCMQRGPWYPELAERTATWLVERLKLTGARGERLGYPTCAIITVEKGKPGLYYHPYFEDVLWLDFDRAVREGLGALEVF